MNRDYSERDPLSVRYETRHRVHSRTHWWTMVPALWGATRIRDDARVCCRADLAAHRHHRGPDEPPYQETPKGLAKALVDRARDP